MSWTSRSRSRRARRTVRREIDVEASPEEVFEALVTEEGRERWLEEPDREIHVESLDAPQAARRGGGSTGSEPATRVEFRIVALPGAGSRVHRHRELAALPARRDGARASRWWRLEPRPTRSARSSFAALADPTRRGMVAGAAARRLDSVPALRAELPITRQAVAKHVATLEHAGLLERAPGSGREVRYGLRGGAIAPAAAWLNDAGQPGRPSRAAQESRRVRLIAQAR